MLGSRQHDADPIDVVALARGLVGDADSNPPLPVVKASQLGQVLKPRPPPLPTWIWILMASAGLTISGVVGRQVYRTWTERKAAEIVTAAAATKAEKQAKGRAAAAKAAKEAEERAEAEKKAAAEREKALAEAKLAAEAAAAAEAAKAGHHHGSHHGGGSAEAQAPVDNEPLPAHLTRDDILKGMQGIQPQVSACFAQYHVPGTALVSMTIAPTGKAQKASVVGPLAGTPTGDCIAKAVRSASFGRFSGKAMAVQYPIILR